MYAKYCHATGPLLDRKKIEIDQTIPDRFESMVGLYRKKLAIQTQNRLSDYDSLNRYANRIARLILNRRDPKSEPMALLLADVIDIVAAMLGVLKSGKFFVVLDSSFPANKIERILHHSGAGAIVTNYSTLGLARQFQNESTSLVNIDEITSNLGDDNLRIKRRPDEFVSILYTSGSTGEPKGVVDNHLVNLHLALLDDTNSQDRSSLVHSVAFGSGRGDIFYSLLNGAAVCQFDLKAEGTDRFAAWLKEQQITICHLPPVAFRTLAPIFENSAAPATLRRIRLTGAPVTSIEFDLYRKCFPKTTTLQINMGSTETRRICGAIVDHDFVFPTDGVPVGYPAPWKRLRLLDDYGDDVAPGEIGEIVLQSRYLTCGYWNDPELNAKKFVTPPESPDERVYRTGDLGQILSDGFLIHVGRKDLMVKIRGFRVEISEVERTLLSHPQISEAAVAVWERVPEDKSLVAYIVAKDKVGLDVEELRKFLELKLSDYMIPGVFMFIDSLPFANGKLDRGALPKPDNARPQLKQAYVPASNAMERQLVRIWQEVLTLHPIGIHDNLFDLGGNSLSAGRIVSRITQCFQVALPLPILFESPTIAALALAITKMPPRQAQDHELEQMLDTIESLSDEEAEQLLREKEPSDGTK
ncbi:MAG: non-ribosomal peptide synthetase [Candidatus Binatia bacterium]